MGIWGTHSFKYELIDGDKTLFTQKEEFTGILVYMCFIYLDYSKDSRIIH